MWKKPADFISDLQVTKFSFRNFQVVENKPRVDVFYEDKKSVTFNLCSDADSPVHAPYGLDSVPPNSDGSRRTLLVNVSDSEVIRVFTELDDFVVASALANSKEWFKKSITEDEVRVRYKPLIKRNENGDDSYAMKFKIKCIKYPTRLHLKLPNGDVVRNGATTEHIGRGSLVAPVLTIFNMWFMNKEFGLGVQAEEIIITPSTSAPVLPMFNFKRPVTILDKDDVNDYEFPESKVQKTTPEITNDPNIHLVDDA